MKDLFPEAEDYGKQCPERKREKLPLAKQKAGK